MEFITVLATARCNSDTGKCDISYESDGERFPTREEAISRGFRLRKSDDFNVAVVSGNSLLSFDWMHEPVGEDAQSLRRIADQLGLTWPPADGEAK